MHLHPMSEIGFVAATIEVKYMRLYIKTLDFRFGHGYMVTIRVGGDPPDLEAVCTFMETNFPQCYLKVSKRYPLFLYGMMFN